MRATLSSPRLTLRPATSDDAVFLHTHWNRPDVRRFLWDDQEVTQTKVEQVLARSDRDFTASGYGLWLVLLSPDGESVGVCGLRQIEGHDLVEILYSIEPHHWGVGLATEAASTVVSYAFDRLGLKELYGEVDDGNDASVRVLEKLGMRFFKDIDVGDRPTPYYVRRSSDDVGERDV